MTSRRRTAADLESDPAYRDGVIDLLGVLAYGELMAFERMAADSALAPTISDKAALAKHAASEEQHFEQLRQRLVDMEVDPETAMTPFVRALEDFHAQTAPSDWFEGLAKAYVGDAIAADFYAEVAQQLDDYTRDLVLEVVGDTGFGEYAAGQLEIAVNSDPRVAGRIALWSRRIVGAALSEAQRVVEEREALSALFVPDSEGEELAAELGELGEALNRVIDRHSARMRRIQLEA
jgi:hypothetical protein